MLTDEQIKMIAGTDCAIPGSYVHAVSRAIESAATAPLLKRIAELEAENTRLEGLVYSPGLWRCAKCKFTLVQRNLNAHNGTVTARDQPGDKCPNCDVNLWRVTERENAFENYEAAESLQIRLNELETKLAQQAEAQEPVAWRVHPFDYCIGSDGVYAVTHFDQQAEAWRRKGWAVEPLFTRPQPAQPLTRDQVSQMRQAAGYFAASPQENADFINGVRHAEMAHGIGVAK